MYLVSPKNYQSHKNVPLAQKNSHNWMQDDKTKSFWGLFCGTLERFYGTPDIYSHFLGTRPNLLRAKDTFLGHPIHVSTWELFKSLNPNLETRLDFVSSPLGCFSIDFKFSKKAWKIFEFSTKWRQPRSSIFIRLEIIRENAKTSLFLRMKNVSYFNHQFNHLSF